MGGRAGAGIEERDADFAPRERSVEDGEVAHDDGEKAEAGAGFTGGEDARDLSVRGYVAKTEREEVRTADVEIGKVADGMRRVS